MNPRPPSQANASLAVQKTPTGIFGFDTMTGGGLPQGRTTLLVGGSGSGKTVFALQSLVYGVQHCKEAGIFVAFEETSQCILANAHSFGWNITPGERQQLFFLDAQPQPDLVPSGDFDFCGMLAALDAQMQATGARRIVFDALDIGLTLLPDPHAQRREIYRLHQWLLARAVTGIITLRADTDETKAISQQPFGFVQFMVDCAVILNHSVVSGVSQRNLRVQKFRGTSFNENETPFLITHRGLEVAVARMPSGTEAQVSNERVSSGVERLDTMLGGGYYRGASVLITGFSGTAKTTLGGAFAQAACQRGERTLFVSYDLDGGEVIRNLASVGIRLEGHVEDGSLRMVSARTISGSAESSLMCIKAWAHEHGARCVVVDPVSSWFKSSKDLIAHRVAERLIDWCKAEGITLLCTRLLNERSVPAEGRLPLQMSILADTWIDLNYLVQAGERNRSLSIIKSHGTAHSNQVRELILSDSGVTLADSYTAGGEILMGTMRWQTERAEQAAMEATEVASALERGRLDAEEAELEARVKALQSELVAKQIEKALLLGSSQKRAGDLSRNLSRLEELRGADATQPGSVGATP